MNSTTQSASGARDSAFPARFEPAVLQLTRSERWFGWLTAIGRARRRLAAAGANPPAAPALARLEASLTALKAKQGPSAKKARPTVHQLLLYLAWATIRLQRIEDARRWLGTIDGVTPELTARLSLRWELLQGLPAHPPSAAYEAEAVKFFADPLLHAQRHQTAIVQVMAALYADGAAKRCATVLSEAHPVLRRADLIRMALAICHCPAAFGSLTEARNHAKEVAAGDPGLPPRLVADGRIIAARAAEWEGQWDAMESFCRQAQAAAPNHLAATYWIVRARLHQVDARPTDGFSADQLRQLPAGARLELEIQLHGQPTLQAAESLLPVLTGEHGSCDAAEIALCAALLERALTTDAARNPLHLRRCVELGTAVAAVAGRLPWVELNCALGAILLDGAYAAALKRLEVDDVQKIALAGTLARIARLLAGMPPAAPTATDEPALVAMNRVLLTLTGAAARIREDELAAALATAADDPLVHAFPALRSAVEILREAFALTLGTDGNSSAPAPTQHGPGPVWGPWLATRSRLLRCPLGKEAECPAELAPRDSATARLIDMWWRWFSLPGTAVPAAVGKARALLNAAKPQDVYTGPGPVCAAVAVAEAQWLDALGELRSCLAQGQHESAVKRANALAGQLKQASPLMRVMWQPVLQYWTAVVAAHAGSPDALRQLEAAATGPLGFQARAQLVLLALQRGEVETAAHGCADLPTNFPAGLYAHALWHARRSDTAAALRLLDEYETRFHAIASPYHLAAERLRAALHERTGNAAESIRLRERLLAKHPHDTVSLLRHIRHELEANYTALAGGSQPTAQADCSTHLAALNRAGPDGPAQTSAYSLLNKLLTETGADTLAGLASEIDGETIPPTRRPPWRLVLASRLLRIGAAPKAREVLAAKVARGPAELARSAAILEIWTELIGLPAAGASGFAANAEQRAARAMVTGAAAVRLAEHARTLQQCGPDDGTARTWRGLAEIAVALAHGEPVPLARWTEVSGSPLAHIAGLFSPDATRRNESAVALQPLLETNTLRWSEEAHLLLGALVAAATQQDEVLVGNYATLEPVLDELPVAGRDLWLAATAVRFQQEKWADILDHFPECIADMTDPLVKLMVELASARQAAVDALRPEKREPTLKTLRSVRNNLKDLLEATAPAA